MRFRFGECVVDDQARELHRSGEQVRITPKAFELLTLLLRERPRAVPKRELQERLWPSTFVVESNLPTLINEVRSAVGDAARNGRHLRTVHGFGYAFCGTAEEVNSEKAAAGSIAVLPFEHDDSEADLAYLAQGLPESLINAFSRFRELRVTPRSTAFRLAHLAADPAALRSRLDVRWIVTGRVASASGDVIVQAEVIDTSTGAQVWGDRFRRESGQIASLDQQIAGDIASALSLQLSNQQPTIAEPLTRNSKAYVLYLKGRFHWNRRTRDSLQRAVDCFREAIELDDRYILPRVGLADAFIAIGTRDLIDPKKAFSQAEHHANVALGLDPLLGEAYTALAAVDELHHWNWARAESRYRQANDLRPGYATAMQWYALHLARRGRHDEARQEIERAAGIDPLSMIINTNRGLVAYLRRDYETALHIFDGALELEPHYEGALFGRALALDCLGQHSEACRVFDRIRISSDDPHVLTFHSYALARAGRMAEAGELIERLKLLRGERFVSGALLAIAFIGSERIDEALDWLEVGVEQRSAWVVYLLTEPRLDVLRSKERFAEVLRRVNLGTLSS